MRPITSRLLALLLSLLFTYPLQANDASLNTLPPQFCHLDRKIEIASGLDKFAPLLKVAGNKAGDMVVVMDGSTHGIDSIIKASFRSSQQGWSAAPVSITPANDLNHIYKVMDAAVDRSGRSMIFYADCHDFSGALKCANAKSTDIYFVACSTAGLCSAPTQIALPHGKDGTIYGAAEFAKTASDDGVFAFSARDGYNYAFTSLFAVKLKNGQIVGTPEPILQIPNDKTTDLNLYKLAVDNQGKGVVATYLKGLKAPYPQTIGYQLMTTSDVNSWTPFQTVFPDERIPGNFDFAMTEDGESGVFMQQYVDTESFQTAIRMRRVVMGNLLPTEYPIFPGQDSDPFVYFQKIGIDNRGVISLGMPGTTAIHHNGVAVKQSYMFTAINGGVGKHWQMEPYTVLPDIGYFDTAYEVSPEGYQFFALSDSPIDNGPAAVFLAKGFGETGFKDSSYGAANELETIHEPGYTTLQIRLQSFAGNHVALIGAYQNLVNGGLAPFSIIVHECN